MKIDTLITERTKLKNKMSDEVQMVRSEYMPRIQALSYQIERMQPGKKNHDVAANVRKFK